MPTWVSCRPLKNDVKALEPGFVAISIPTQLQVNEAVTTLIRVCRVFMGRTNRSRGAVLPECAAARRVSGLRRRDGTYIADSGRQDLHTSTALASVQSRCICRRGRHKLSLNLERRSRCEILPVNFFILPAGLRTVLPSSLKSFSKFVPSKKSSESCWNNTKRRPRCSYCLSRWVIFSL